MSTAPQHEVARGASAATAELLRDLADMVRHELVEVGTDPTHAAAIGETVSEKMADLHGGRLMYFPKGSLLKARRRWLLIWEDFNGTNHAALSIKYGMNVKQVYRVLAVVREMKRREAQPDMFEAQAATEKL